MLVDMVDKAIWPGWVCGYGSATLSYDGGGADGVVIVSMLWYPQNTHCRIL